MLQESTILGTCQNVPISDGARAQVGPLDRHLDDVSGRQYGATCFASKQSRKPRFVVRAVARAASGGMYWFLGGAPKKTPVSSEFTISSHV
eukprot:235891-Prymnesium_polylepis.1